MYTDIEKLIKYGESTTLEFKEKPNEDVKKYLNTVVAFANGAGGSIVFGVNDDGEMVGLTGNYSEIADQLTDRILQEIAPSFFFTVNPYTVDGKQLIVLRVNHGPETPYYYVKEGMEQGTYVRINATTRRCSPEMLKDLMIQGEKRSPDMVEIIGRSVSLDDPDYHALCEFASSKSGKNVSLVQLCNMGLLKRIDENIVPTIGYSLLTDNPCSFARIECGHFKGTDRSIFLDKATCTGPLYLQIDSAAKFVIDNVKTNVTIEGLFRKEEPEIPYGAIREVITYAVVHRCSQISSSPISVGVYDNIVEVISPGLLPDGLTVEEAVSGCRCHRNRALSEFFIAVKMMEGWGSGLRRAFDQCLSHGLAEPELDTVGENIRITIYRRGVKPAVSNGILPLDDFQKAILKVLAENPSLTLPEVAAMLNVSPATVNKAVKALKASDRLSREGSNKKGRWVVHSRI